MVANGNNEIGRLVMEPTIDHQVIRSLFTNCIEASKILDVDRDFRQKLKELRTRIAPNQIEAKILSKAGRRCVAWYKNKMVQFETEKGITYRLSTDLKLEYPFLFLSSSS